MRFNDERTWLVFYRTQTKLLFIELKEMEDLFGLSRTRTFNRFKVNIKASATFSNCSPYAYMGLHKANYSRQLATDPNDVPYDRSNVQVPRNLVAW